MFSRTPQPVKSTTTPSQLLTPENCLAAGRIRTFLRLSRFATDDSIRQHLNEVNDCHSYFRSRIVPQWLNRDEVIDFCLEYAQSLRQKTELKQQQSKSTADFDLRLDPYAWKDFNDNLEKQFALADSVRAWTENERQVETIVRADTIDLLVDKCGEYDWLGEFHRASKLATKS